LLQYAGNGENHTDTIRKDESKIERYLVVIRTHKSRKNAFLLFVFDEAEEG
jgi:hypothetical protein